MTEYWFYHLETSMLEGVLPELLDKTRSRGWRALVKMPEDRLSHMDKFLWTYKDDSFLPHGRDDEPLADQQPVILSAAATSSTGHDCVQAARAKWKTLKDGGANLSYWQQNDQGRWEKKA